jgi:hypothetical protein
MAPEAVRLIAFRTDRARCGMPTPLAHLATVCSTRSLRTRRKESLLSGGTQCLCRSCCPTLRCPRDWLPQSTSGGSCQRGSERFWMCGCAGVVVRHGRPRLRETAPRARPSIGRNSSSRWTTSVSPTERPVRGGCESSESAFWPVYSRRRFGCRTGVIPLGILCL